MAQKVKSVQLETVVTVANQETEDRVVLVAHLVVLVLLVNLVNEDLLAKSAPKDLWAARVKREDVAQRDPLEQWALREMQVNVVFAVILALSVQQVQKESQAALAIAVRMANKVNPVQWEMRGAKVTLVPLVMMVNKDLLVLLVHLGPKVFKVHAVSADPLVMPDPRVHPVLPVRSRSSMLQMVLKIILTVDAVRRLILIK